jgi:putative ABC transport system permease protein
MLGFSSPQEAIGKTIVVFGGKHMDIIGVMADFHQKSLHSPLEPILLFPSYGNGDFISVKIAPNDVGATLADIRKRYETFFPGNIFDYFFLDEKFNRQYKDDLLFGKVFSLFAGFAIFVACLGLFALSLATTAQKTKEIGVRKVLGASASQIVAMLLNDFLKLVLIANLIAWPLAWYVIQSWLDDFTFRTQINLWVLLLSGMLALLVGLITISFQSIKASLVNPIKSLRNQ